MTEQMTWIGMRTRINNTNNSPTKTEVPGIGELAAPKTYSIFSEVAKPSAKPTERRNQ
jgi:hypothetical protein